MRHFCLDTGPSGHLFSEQMTHADCLRFNLQERILSQLPHLDTLVSFQFGSCFQNDHQHHSPKQDIELFPTYIPKTLGTIAHNLKEMHVTVNALQGYDLFFFFLAVLIRF